MLGTCIAEFITEYNFQPVRPYLGMWYVYRGSPESTVELRISLFKNPPGRPTLLCRIHHSEPFCLRGTVQQRLHFIDTGFASAVTSSAYHPSRSLTCVCFARPSSLVRKSLCNCLHRITIEKSSLAIKICDSPYLPHIFFCENFCGVVQVWRSSSIYILFDRGVLRYFF